MFFSDDLKELWKLSQTESQKLNQQLEADQKKYSLRDDSILFDAIQSNLSDSIVDKESMRSEINVEERKKKQKNDQKAKKVE